MDGNKTENVIDMKEARPHNRRLAKKRVQCFNEALCFVSTSVLADSLVLRNPLLRQAPKRYQQFMKKINKSISKEYLPVKIYLDDIEQIVALFDENQLKYTIETEQYKYDSLSELIDSAQEKKIKSLEIKTYQPYITIEFHKMWAKVYVSSDETFTTGIFHKIDAIINKSKRLMPFIYSYYFVWIMNIVLTIEGTLNKNGKLFPEYIDTTISTVWLLWLARILYVRMVTHSSIQLIKKEHITNFFQRKRDDLILAVLSALVGVVFGVVATILTTKYLN